MAYSRKYDFQSGTRISSSQVDDEFNQLIDAANTLQSSINSTKTAAQMKKITTDNGSVKLDISDKSKDLLAELQALGRGLYSWYAISDTVNLPPSKKSARGLFHQTSDGYGWAIAFDYEGSVYSNYLDNGNWEGWQPLYSKDANVLWKGSAYPMAATTIKPSKKLSDCQNGWMLVWSDNDPTKGSNDFQWVQLPVHKGQIGLDPDGTANMVFAIPTSDGATNLVKTKILNITDTAITGDDTNDDDGPDDAVLRAVIEF